MFAIKQLPHLLNLQTISDVFGGYAPRLRTSAHWLDATLSSVIRRLRHARKTFVPIP